MRDRYPLWVTRDTIRAFNQELFEKLSVAYGSGDTRQLQELWNAAESWNEPI